MDRILIILKKENGPMASSAPALGLNTIIFKHVYWFMQQTQVSVYRTNGPLVYNENLTFDTQYIYMYVFQAIRKCGFWKAHNKLFDSKRLPEEPHQLLTILTQFCTCMLLYCSYSTEKSYRPGEGRMRLYVVSTKLISTKRRPLDIIENSLMLLAVSLPQAIKCLKKC